MKEQFEVTLPKFGAPVVARWAFIAFNRSEHQAKARTGIAMRQLDEIEEERLAKEEAEKQRRLKEAAMKVWEMRQVMRPQLRDEALAEEVRLGKARPGRQIANEILTISPPFQIMTDEWGHMTKGALLDKVVPSAIEQAKIKR